MIIILSGPPGAGKSTVAEALAEKFPQSVQFSVDTIRGFIKGGNIPPWETGEAAEKQMQLGDDITNDIVKRYISNRYVVILDGVYSDKDIEKYRSLFRDVYGFLLLPSLDVLRERDSKRDADKQMPHRVEPLYNAYTSQKNEYFEIIDSSSQSIEETVEYIYQKVKK